MTTTSTTLAARVKARYSIKPTGNDRYVVCRDGRMNHCADITLDKAGCLYQMRCQIDGELAAIRSAVKLARAAGYEVTWPHTPYSGARTMRKLVKAYTAMDDSRGSFLGKRVNRPTP